MRDMTEEELSQALPKLMARLKHVAFNGRIVNERMRNEVDEVLESWHRHWLFRGLRAPKLVHLLVQGQLYVFRADRDRKDIDTLAMNVVRDFKGNVDLTELAREFARAYPQTKPQVLT